MGQFFLVYNTTDFFCKFLMLDSFKNPAVYVKWVYKTDFDDHFSLHSTAAAARQHMTQRHNHIASYFDCKEGFKVD